MGLGRHCSSESGKQTFQPQIAEVSMDVVILLETTVLGALPVPPIFVLVSAALLTAFSARRKFEIAKTYPDTGSGRIVVGALFLSFANNTVFSLLAFALGYGIAQLL